MSFHVNFSSHGKELNSAYQAVISEQDDTNWLIYAYDKGTYDLRVQATGDGGLEELNDEFSDGKVQFAFAKVIDPNTELPKFVFIGWCGSGVPELRKAFFNSQLSEVSKFVKSFHVQINARDEADVEPNLIMKRVAESSGANYSVHKETTKPQPRVTPVGSVYKKTEIPDIAALQKQSMTKDNAPKPVGTNYTPVQTTPRKLEQRWNANQNQNSGADAVRAERERFEKEVRERELQRNKDSQFRARTESEAAAKREREENERRQREEQDRQRQHEEESRRRDEQRKQEEEECQRHLEEEQNRLQLEQEEEYHRQQREEVLRQEQEEQDRQVKAEQDKRRQEEENMRRQQEQETELRRKQQEEQEREEERQRQEEAARQAEAQLNQSAQRAVESTQAASAAAVANSSQHHVGLSAVVMFEYDATESNEMSLVEGEVITQIDQVDEGWWFGVSEDGKKQGLFPANYVQVVEEPIQEEPPAPTPNNISTSAPQDFGNVAVALYDYEADEDNEISFTEGDTITHIEFVSEDWWQGNNGKAVGLFPANYVELNQ